MLYLNSVETYYCDISMKGADWTETILFVRKGFESW